MLGGDGVVVLNITLNFSLAVHAPVLATYVTENMRFARALAVLGEKVYLLVTKGYVCLLYTSPSPRDQRGSRMPSSA